MSKAVQTILSLNEDDLVTATDDQKYKLGSVFTVVNSLTPLVYDKYIYLRDGTTGGTPAFIPRVVINGRLENAQSAVFQAVVPFTLAAPGVFTAVPQIVVGINQFAFYLLEGKGRAQTVQTTSNGQYLSLENGRAEFTIGASVGVPYGNDTRGAALAIAFGSVMDIFLFNKPASVQA